MGQFNAVAIRQVLEIFGQLLRAWHLGAVHQNRNNRDIAHQGGCGFDANEVRGIVQTAGSVFVLRIEPMRAHHNQQHATLGYALFNGLTKVAPRFDAGDIHEDHVFAKALDQIVKQSARLTLRVIPAIADEDGAQSCPSFGEPPIKIGCPLRGGYRRQRLEQSLLFYSYEGIADWLLFCQLSPPRKAYGAAAIPLLGNADFRISAVHLPQRFADFPHRGIGPHSVHDVGHGVGGGNVAVRSSFRFLRRGLLQRIQRAEYLVMRSPSAQGFEFGRLLAGDRLADVEDVGRALFDHEFVDPDHYFFAGLDRALVLVGRLGDLFLRISALDRLYHAAHGIELAEVVPRAVFHLQGLIFYKI